MVLKILGNRNFILPLAVVIGLLLGDCAYYTKVFVVPLLALVVLVSTIGVSSDVFRSPSCLFVPTMAGLFTSYLLNGCLILGLNSIIIKDNAFWIGFIILASVPPAVAVIPFTDFFGGDVNFSTLGEIGSYLASLLLTPFFISYLLKSDNINSFSLFITMIELILFPLLLSRLLLWSGAAWKIEPFRGSITNWSFFIVTYTVVGMNREVIFDEYSSLIPVAVIAFVSVFILGFFIDFIGRRLDIARERVISLVMLGTLKNGGLAAGLALTLFDERTAIPATVTSIALILFPVWLSFKKRYLNKV